MCCINHYKVRWLWYNSHFLKTHGLIGHFDFFALKRKVATKDKQKEKETQEMRVRKEIERREKMRNRARERANKAAINADKQRKLDSLKFQREMDRLDEEVERAMFR